MVVVSRGFQAKTAMWPMPCVVILGMSDSHFLESEVLGAEVRG